MQRGFTSIRPSETMVKAHVYKKYTRAWTTQDAFAYVRPSEKMVQAHE